MTDGTANAHKQLNISKILNISSKFFHGAFAFMKKYNRDKENVDFIFLIYTGNHT